jgi:SAM-dependent methyltransferase
MYVFDNAAPQAAARLAALAGVYDPGTIRHLSARGVGHGWRCLEVGGGLGTIARWLAERVGPRGWVLTTDIDTRHLDEHRLPNLEVRLHDVAKDPLPDATFDLAHARLVLSHVSDPDLALARMARAVKPGGWIVVEDFEMLPSAPLAADTEAGDEIDHISKTLHAMRTVAGPHSHQRLGRSLARRLRGHGVTNVESEGRVFLWQGGSTGATLSRLNFEQLREPILATGRVTAAEFEADLAALEGEDFEVRSPILWTAWGQRPRS